MASLERLLTKRLRLKIKREKKAPLPMTSDETIAKDRDRAASQRRRR